MTSLLATRAGRRRSIAFTVLISQLPKLFGFSKIPQGDRTKNPNPGVSNYKTKDERYISLILLQSDKFWTDFVTRLGVPGPVRAVRAGTVSVVNPLGSSVLENPALLGKPEWLAVKTGLFGTNLSFVPIREAIATPFQRPSPWWVRS